MSPWSPPGVLPTLRTVPRGASLGLTPVASPGCLPPPPRTDPEAQVRRPEQGSLCMGQSVGEDRSLPRARGSWCSANCFSVTRGCPT